MSYACAVFRSQLEDVRPTFSSFARGNKILSASGRGHIIDGCKRNNSGRSKGFSTSVKQKKELEISCAEISLENICQL